MKRKVLIAFGFLIFGSVLFVLGRFTASSDTKEFSIIPTPVPTPLSKYSIPSLSESYKNRSAIVTITKQLKDEKDFSSFEFDMEFDPTFEQKEPKHVSGLLNIPKKEDKFPLVVMVRGYVDPKIYQTGVGTKNAGEYFAKNGYITIAPDFLGYGDSDSEAGNIFESRFQTYTTLLALLNTTKEPYFKQMASTWDGENVFLWAHSNGGQIALTTLAVMGEPIPTVLWAPVTKPFPYSVLYYTDESIDGGKFIRKELSKFENIYNIDQYTFTNYLSKITAPIEIEQGTLDDAVPYVWSRSTSALLKKQGLDITYNEFKGSDHNLRPAWDEVVEKNLLFFEKHIKSDHPQQ